MPLSNELISQFVKITNDEQTVKTDSTVYGTTTVIDGDVYVRIDGSDRLVPITTRTVSVDNEDRVEVTIKNHEASITGNVTTPAASSAVVSELGEKVSSFDTIVADMVSTDLLYAELANIKTLDVEEFTAINAAIQQLEADKIEVEDLTAINADIENLKSNKLDVEVADVTYATIEGLTATDADIYNLKATYATVENLNATNAEIDSIKADYVKTETLEADYITADDIQATYVTAENVEANYVKTETLEADYITAINAAIQQLEADKIEVEDLTAINTDIENLKTNKLDAEVANLTYATIEGLTATDADIYNLKATYATVENLNATNAEIDSIKADYVKTETLEADYITADDIQATYVKATDLEADHISADTIASQVAKIDTIIFGSASGNVVHSDFSNAVIAQMGDAWIEDAMIDNVSASKITSGTIITNNVQVQSEDGSLIIADETIQIIDANDKVRVQIGKDASNDYSINIWDAEGKLMFSEGGLTEDAIKDAIIRNDMVSETANISASKLDISSLFTVINEDGTHTLNSNKIYLDNEKQTLDVAFSNMTETTDGLETKYATLSSSVDGLTSTVGTLSTDVGTLETNYSVLSQDVSGIEAIVASHTTELTNKADNSTVTEVNDKVTSLTADLNGFKTTVSDTYALKTGNLVKNGFGEYLDNTGFSAATYTRGDCPENEGIYGYFNGSARSALIPYDPSKTYNYEYYCRLHEGRTGNSYFSIIPIDIDGNPINYNQVVSDYNTSLFYLAEDLNVGDTCVKVVDLTNWKTDTTQTYQRAFLFFGYSDSTGYVYPDGTYSRYVYSNIYASNDSVDKSTNTITLTKAWSGKAFPAGSCFAQVTSGATYCYFGQKGSINYTEWKEWTGTIKATDDHRLPYVSNIQVFLYNAVADYCGIYLAEKPYGLNDLENRVSTAESNITQNADEIALRVKTTDFNDLESRVSTAESNITQNADEIALRVKTTDFNDLESRVSTAESNITQNADEIALRVKTTDFNDLESRVSTAESNITQNADSIALCVTETEFNTTLDGYYTSSEADSVIEQKANEISLSVTQTEIENLQIGGRNYATIDMITNHSLTNYSYNNYVWSGTHTSSLNGLKIDFSSLETGEYVISFKVSMTDGELVKIGGHIGSNTIKAWYVNGEKMTTVYTANNTTAWSVAETDVYEIVIYMTINNPELFYIQPNRGVSTSVTVSITDIMVEKGNKKSDWTPAPEDLETEVDALTSRVTTAESNITQNADEIALRVTKTELNTTLDGYYTSSEADSAIEQKANEISLSVAQTEIENLQIGSRNYFVRSNIGNLAWYSTDGSLREGANYRSFSFKVNAGETWTIYRTDATNNRWGVYWCDSEPVDGIIVIGSAFRRDTQAANVVTKMTVPSGATWGFVYLSTQADEIPNIMLEKGNKATDWSPAPEDLETEVDALTSRVTTAESNITQNADEITLRVKTADFNDLESRVTTAESNITQNADEIALRVTKTEFNTTLDGYYTSSEADSAIQQKANEISLSVAQTEIENLQIGGTNLLLNSSFTENKDEWGGSSTTLEFVELDGVKCAHFSGGLGLTRNVTQSIYDKIDLDDLNQEYVFSADIRLDNYIAGTTNPFVQLYFSGHYDKDGTSTWMGATTISGNGNIVIQTTSGEWTRVNWVVRFARLPIDMTIYVYARDFTGDLYFKNLKLEKGNKATDWSPAPEDLETEVDALTSRVTTAESNITQNADEITLRVTQETFDETLDGYYTKAEVISEIEASEEGIILSVDSKIADVAIGGRNLLKNSRMILLTSPNEANYPMSYTEESENGRTYYRYIRTDTTLNPTKMFLQSGIPLSDVTEDLYGREVTFSFLTRASHEVTAVLARQMVVDGKTTTIAAVPACTINNLWQRISMTSTIDVEYELTNTNLLRFNPTNIIIPDGEIDGFWVDICEWKIELGNKATDWTPAPEEIDSEIDDATNKADNALEGLIEAQTQLQLLTDSIAQLVRSGETGTLVKQTSDGLYYFDISELESTITAANTAIGDLDGVVNETKEKVDILNYTAETLQSKVEYVKSYTDENDQPCLELGEGDSVYKLFITNTGILMKDGTETPTQVTNKQLVITKATVREELQVGDENDTSITGVWLFKRRSNGNIGLIWKDVSE